MKRVLILLLSAFFFFSATSIGQAETKQQITLLFFWSESCPHCAAENRYLEKIKDKYPELHIEKMEVSKSKKNQEILISLSKKLGFRPNSVPVTIVGDKFVLGFAEGTTNYKIEELILNAENTSTTSEEICEIDKPCGEENNHKIKIPFLGEIESKNFSLPMLSIVIGALDGFNPCAMWTLLFLISLLLGMKDRKRMWILGTAFIVASASVYFIFMSAWLNLFLFIGFIAAVRIVIGLVALGGGAYSIRDFLTNKEGGCKVTGDKKRKVVFEKIKKTVYESSFILALLGIITLAFAVNLVELICSAGLPAIFTQILAMSELPTWRYYLYILIYIFFFMLDDLIIFFIAMFTLQLTGITTKYSRISRLVGGILMLAIGLTLIFKPEWLMFG